MTLNANCNHFALKCYFKMWKKNADYNREVIRFLETLLKQEEYREFCENDTVMSDLLNNIII